jgi:hypothetical protein
VTVPELRAIRTAVLAGLCRENLTQEIGWLKRDLGLMNDELIANGKFRNIARAIEIEGYCKYACKG